MLKKNDKNTRLYNERGDFIEKWLTQHSLKWHGAFGLRRSYGQHVAQAFFYSPNVIPTRVINYGFTFKYGEINSALRDLSKNLGILKALRRRILMLRNLISVHGDTIRDNWRPLNEQEHALAEARKQTAFVNFPERPHADKKRAEN